MANSQPVPERLINKMKKFVKNHSGKDFGEAHPYVERTEYKKKGKDIKRKGGKPPVQYFFVEEFVDLRIHLEREEYSEALPLYFKLKHIV